MLLHRSRLSIGDLPPSSRNLLRQERQRGSAEGGSEEGGKGADSVFVQRAVGFTGVGRGSSTSIKGG